MKDNRVGDEKLLWLGVTKNVEKYVDKYDLCQRIKNRIEILAEKLMANEISEGL